MDTRCSSVNNIRRFKQRQILEPEAGCFRLPMPELPWLDDLIGLTPIGAEKPHGVFQGDARYRHLQQVAHKLQGHALLRELVLPPTGPAVGNMCAGREANHHVPRALEEDSFKDIARNVPRAIAPRSQYIAGIRIVAPGPEGVANFSTLLAPYQDTSGHLRQALQSER